MVLLASALFGYVVFVGKSVDHVPPLKNRYSSFEFWAWLVVTDEKELPPMSELLFSACDDMTGDPDKISLIVAHGGDPDWRSEFKGMTPLMFAASMLHHRACLALLREGADPHLKDEEGKNALYFAANATEYSYTNRKKVVSLIRQFMEQ